MEAAPVMAAAAEKTAENQNIQKLVLTVVSDKTGYPTDMIDVEMELETDLGIDSIKRVEILSDINKELGEIFTAEDVASLSTKGSISGIVEYLESIAAAAPVNTAPAAAAAVETAAPAVVGGTASAVNVEKVVLEAISDKTGYPTDMIDVEMELETDLGIDSIKRVEIFSAVIETLGCNLSADEIGELSGLPDIQSITKYLAEKMG